MVRLSGPWSYRLFNLLLLLRSALAVSARRLLRGPLHPGWSWALETMTYLIRTQTQRAFDMPDIAASRALLDAASARSPTLGHFATERVEAPVPGEWFRPARSRRPVTLLYFHGGGYVYHPRAGRNLTAAVAEAVGGVAFALDYRLAPEHPFPAQLDDALAAYTWLLSAGHNPQRLVVAGDSAGGHLALSLLLALRRHDLPQPALAVLLSPWTDLSNPGASMTANERTDNIQARNAERWADWYRAGRDPRDPLISPAYAELGKLAPLYIQAGGAEILIDMIREFAGRAREQGAEVTLEEWAGMNHDFQAFGELLPQSREALARIDRVVGERLPGAAG